MAQDQRLQICCRFKKRGNLLLLIWIPICYKGNQGIGIYDIFLHRYFSTRRFRATSMSPAMFPGPVLIVFRYLRKFCLTGETTILPLSTFQSRASLTERPILSRMAFGMVV